MRKAAAHEVFAVGALALLVVATVAWWSLALWPAPAEVPEWLERTRAVCFGRTASGLPDASGWLLLIGQPLGMLAALAVGWGRELRAGLAAVTQRRWGQRGLGITAALLMVGLLLAGARVAHALGAATFDPGLAGEDLPPASYPRLDRPAPTVQLLDQDGSRVGVSSFRGRPLLVSFAFGHCETVCPVVVHRVLAVRDRLAPELDPAVLILTLDPWRDTPSRLSHLAEQWELPATARVLSGTIEEVESALDDWEVPRVRDEATGDVTHPALVYLVDGAGRIRYASNGGVDALVSLARRMVDER